MGQFKPMVKMETTEPSVELKLAKGGAVKMKKGGSTTKAKKMAMGGGAMDMMSGTPALVGRPAVNAPVRSPMKPSMASRRKAMMAKKPMAMPAMPTMKKGGESKKTHMAEMSKMKGLEKELKSHASKPASKGHKGLKTGGVTDGQGGYKTGGVALGNGGGFKHGGKSSKKAYATGGTVDSGKPVAMPQGAKKPSQPVSTNRQAGTFKTGGKVMMNGGGTTSGQGAITDRERKTAQDLSKGAYDKTGKYNRELEDALNPFSMVKELAGKARDAFLDRKPYMQIDMTGKKPEDFLDRKPDRSIDMKGKKPEDFLQKLRGQGAVTETERSVTVSPAGKKRGGRAC